jgi:hypothetical protein
MRIAGNAAKEILRQAGEFVRPGITTDAIDVFVHDLTIKMGGYPSPLNYHYYPKSVCTSVNEVICHGIPDSRVLLDGDIINLDVTIFLNGVHGDTNATFAVGNISDFKSIRFMRMVMRDFNDSAVLRFGYINMVRADWRRYTNSLKTPGVVVPTDPNDGTKFVVSTVNLEENSKRSPVAYVTPPGIVRVQNMASLGTVLENEQSLSMLTCNLQPGDARGAFKTVQHDIRNYKRIQLFVHAEEVTPNTIQDGEVSAFIRFGTDLTSNYYEYEIPLSMTRGFVNGNAPTADKLVWPDANMIDLDFQNLRL